ncbi:hypothetical protein BTJ68_04452 [Hortaea werneckii EXF-2000]|uniref:Uncharacterized protein n=2 Tax=Hortaea werneckii TaxID=91943 RepID=A0A3M7I9Y2_HORWE|nr:hypothetical protein BTJ68_04452 [Hortaea werneckii EXF-2000]RMZ22116.1 hypothetical protein D0859_13864 [Hortaea werneckii]
MPNMFSRRRGSSAHRPPPDTATMNAATAAAGSAFLSKSTSNASLSSAAAAAALRSQTSSPEPVGNLVTKRMARRGSQSSIGSGSVIGSSTRGGVGRGGLSRQNSSGSMTERTFRSPSPSGRAVGGMVAPADTPPVPPLPKTTSGSNHKRSASMEPPPRRVTSPSPRVKGSRGVSVDRASLPPPSASKEAKRLSNVLEAPEEKPLLEAQDGSVNFSRPMSPSAPAKKVSQGNGGWYVKPSAAGAAAAKARPSTSDGTIASKAAAGTAQPGSQSTTNKQVKKKASKSMDGASLAQEPKDTLYPGNQGTSYENSDSTMVFDPATRTFKSKPRETPKQPEPSSPKMRQPASSGLKPGTYDPATRTIVPDRRASTSLTPDPGLKMKKQRNTVSPVDTSLLPPPKNPARYSPTSDRPPSSLLHKQPSVVREDPEGEEEAAKVQPLRVQSMQPNGYVQTSAGPVKKYTTPKSQQKRATSLDVPRQSIEGGNRNRNGSLSPSRSAHFSPSPIVENTRHVPPPRSVSPAKSAMKHSHSPSSSIRNSSPMVKAPASDVSDTTSMTSQEGLLPKKKKKARVSFDDKPEDIDAANAASPPKAINRERSPAVDDEIEDLMKPRPALPSFGSVRRSSGRSEPELAQRVTEMAPERREKSSDHAVAGVVANSHTEEADENEPLPPEVVSKEATYESDGTEDEFKPETESTPARALTTDELIQATNDAEPVGGEFATSTARRLAADRLAQNDMPSINLDPPTPGETPADEDSTPVHDAEKRTSYNFNASSQQQEEVDVNADLPSNEGTETIAAPQSNDEHEPAEAEEVTALPTMQRNTEESEHDETVPLDIIGEGESDDSAVFSDAAEDLTEGDEGGFASLNAILESPATDPKEKFRVPASPLSPDSPLSKRTVKPADSEPVKDWSETTAYWKQLSKQQRDQIERAHLSSDDEARPSPVVAVHKSKRKSARQQTHRSEVDEDEAPVTSKAASAVGSTTAMPKTMRNRQSPTPPAPAASPAPGSQPEKVTMRRSMRDSGGGGMTASMRSGPPPQRPQSAYSERTKQTAARPMSAMGASTSAAGGAMRRRADSDDMPMPQETAFPKMQTKRMSQQSQQGPPASPSAAHGAKSQKQIPKDDSDSESSFRKKRRPSASTVDSAGRYTMKRSLRSNSFEGPEQRPSSPNPPKKSGAFSMRSMSPTGSVMSESGRGQRLRQSLRSGSVGPAAAPEPKRMSLRNSQPTGRQARSSSARPATSSGTMSKSNFRSRFGRDSDDEDEPKRSFFRSRFADSDDDEPSSPRFMPANLTPVRGIPKRKGQRDGDSTDLSDEEVDLRKASRKSGRQSKSYAPTSDDVDKAMAAARRNLGMTDAVGANDMNQGSALSKGSLRKPAADQVPQSPIASEMDPQSTPEKKRRGFMGSILRRNRNSSMSVQQAPPSPQAANAPDSPSMASKLARRGSQQPRMRRGDSYQSNITAPTSRPDDQHEWPLPNGNRPATSDGPNPEAVRLARTLRGPDMARPKSRVGFAAGSKDGLRETDTVYSAKTGKKKRFPMLRKAFGLND